MEEFNAYAKETKPKDKIESYKDRYGKVYLVSISINPDDNTTVDMNFCFKKPPVSSYDRYVKTTSQSPTKALKAFVMDNIVEEQEAEIAAALEEYPALALNIGEKLLSMLGLSKDINLKML